MNATIKFQLILTLLLANSVVNLFKQASGETVSSTSTKTSKLNQPNQSIRSNHTKKTTSTTTTDAMFVQPSFDRASENVTVIIGNSAVLPCFISNLGDHKVAWIKVANMDILAIGDYRVTNDDRIKLIHGYLSDWSLSIQPVNEEDSGEYICQVNTEPQIITRIFLHVMLPPKIIEEKSSLSSGPIQEGHPLRLHCHAEGTPTPKITWLFRKRVSHHLNNLTHHVHQPHSFDLSQVSHHKFFEHQTITIDENSLSIKNISRSFSGLFECIANNSVLPAASRKIRISVEFAPEVSVQSDKIEQLAGLDTRFECKIKANPLMNHYWMKDSQVIENNPDVSDPNSKYEINIYNQNSVDYLTVSVLTVKNISKNDFGVYQCFAVNAYNTSRAEVELKEIVMRRQPQATAKISASRILFYSNLQSNNKENNELFATQMIDASTTPGVFTKHLLYSPKQARKTLNHTLNKQQLHVNKIKQQANLDQEKETMFSLFNGGFRFVSNSATLLVLVSFLFSYFMY